MRTLMKLDSLTESTPRNKNQQPVRMGFSNADLVDSNTMGVELIDLLRIRQLVDTR